MAQPVQHFFEPRLGGLGSSTLQCFCERLQMFTRRMKVERFNRCFEAILRQIPQPDRSVHHHVNNFGSSHPSALRLRMHSFAKVHGRSFRWRRHGKLFQQQPASPRILNPLLQPINHRRLDLPSLYPLRILFTRSGSPVRAPLPRHPAVRHDHQTKGWLVFDRGRGR